MTISFSNSSPKIPKSGIFDPKFKNFYFCTKLCKKTNSRRLILNMTMVFQNCCTKKLNKAFLGSKFKNSNFCTKICNYTIWRAFIRNMIIFFQHFKDPNGAFLFQNLFFFLFWMKFYSFTKLSVLIKNLIIIFVKLQPKNSWIRYFWSQV